MNDRSWDDLRLFLHVARAGGLAGAARHSGLSAPTIGRRMLALEHSLGRTLFDRSAQGYRLALDGQTLFGHAQAMERASAAVDQWQHAVLDKPIVSIGADALTLRFLIDRLDSFWSSDDDFRICLKVLQGPLDMTHRAFNIAVTGTRMENGNVAVRRSVTRHYAVYCAFGAADTQKSWVSLGTDVAMEPWMRWVFERPDLNIAAWVNAPRTLVDAIESGAGRSVLPCFVGKSTTGLVRCGEPIAALTHDTWIVSHDDDRRRPEIRTTLDRLTLLIEECSSFFAA